MNDFINLSAVENSPEISTALSSSKTGDNSQSAKDKAVVVHVFFSQNKNIEDLQEFQLLAESANVEILQIITTSRATPQAKYFIGEGKAQEIADAVKTLDADVVLVNHQLTPAQTRNLESICQCRVVDRTGVILDIFAQRARSHEGKLQVELAQLKHLSTRLVRRKTGLDQQKGAVGLRGPGETQLETDRRLIKVRIAQLQNRLAKVEKQRNQNRQTRQKADIPTISLVGYTNAGKSTLFNFITQANVYAEDQLFATLDPTLRRLQIQDVGTAILADTVGFVRQLPHDLVSAFKSTLQETVEASLLLHVIDAADARKIENIEAVNLVLEEIKADKVPALLVYNKIDLLENVAPHIEYDDENKPVAVYLSAHSGEGLDLLLEAIKVRLKNEILSFTLTLLPQEGKIRHVGISFHDRAEVLERILTEYPEIEVVQIQFNYVDYDDPAVQSRKCYEVCRKFNKPVIVMEPVKGGNLVNLPENAKAVLEDLHGGSPASYAIRFVAGFPGMMMVLSGMSNMEQMQDNISFMRDFKPLDETERAALEKVQEIFHSKNLIPSTACRYCTDGCPKHISIPDLFAIMNTKQIHHDRNADCYYEDVHTAPGRKASDCLKCGKCEKVCPQHLPIRKLLEQVAAEFEKAPAAN